MKISKIELKLIRYFLGLRCKMTYRLIRPLGWFRIIVLLLFMAGLATSMVQLISGEYGPWYLVTTFAVLLVSIQFSRKDRNKLRSLRLEPFMIFVAEYLVLAAPVIVLLLFNSAFFPAQTVLFLCPAVAWIPAMIVLPERKSLRISLINTSRFPYEWISGLRKRGIVLFFLLAAGVVASWLHIVAGWILTVILTCLVVFFYMHCEPEAYIRHTANSPLAFIVKKLEQGIGYYILISAAVWAVLIFNYPSQWVYTGLILLANLLLLITITIGKYAFYSEHRNLEIILSLLFGLGFLCLIIPYLVPVLVLLVGWLTERAINQLKEVYDIH